MDFDDPVLRDPVGVSPRDLVLPSEYRLEFPGFSAGAFGVLARLRERPRIEQYQKEKEAVRRLIVEPFRAYRDDLVVNWVLPNRLRFETERNVFSRLLKNDFGAGGCHHHLWMAFYRPEHRRLTDLQITHRIDPDRFAVSLYAGGYGDAVLERALQHIADEPQVFEGMVNALLDVPEWSFRFAAGSGRLKRNRTYRVPVHDLSKEVRAADAIWLRKSFGRDDVLEWGEGLVERALAAVSDLWPVYHFLGR